MGRYQKICLKIDCDMAPAQKKYKWYPVLRKASYKHYSNNLLMEFNLATWLRLVKFTEFIGIIIFEFQSYKLSFTEFHKCNNKRDLNFSEFAISEIAKFKFQ